MANLIPLAIADVELQLAAAVAVGGTTLTLNSANDDDGNALPAGMYCFTIDSGTSNKEYLIGQLNGVNITSVKSVSRQGVETTGAARSHRVGAPCIITNFATLQRVADILRGQLNLDGASPISYDAEPTLGNREELATVGYVLDTVNGGTVVFDQQVITGTAGESIVAGNLVYFNTADQEWYKTDADTAATVEGVQLGIALGTGSDGVAISGGIQISGTYTTSGLTAGASYYASNTAGAIASSAGTTSQIVGLALSTTKLLIISRNPQTLSTNEKAAVAGGSNFGTPSSTNKFITEAYNASASGVPVVRTYVVAGSPHTWTKPAGLKYIVVEAVGGGGGGGGGNEASGDVDGCGGGAGGYAKKLIPVASLGATETVTVGAAGAAGAAGTGTGGTGGTTSFGSHITCTGGTGGDITDDIDGVGVGGSGTGGDINIYGGNGTPSRNDSGVTNGQSGGSGGNSMFGIGGLGNSVGIGGSPTGYGSGGAGTHANGADRVGVAGAPGLVVVTEYYS